MASKSKNKGKGFEREVCKILGEIYDDNFERVPHSGAFVGGRVHLRKIKSRHLKATLFHLISGIILIVNVRTTQNSPFINYYRLNRYHY